MEIGTVLGWLLVAAIAAGTLRAAHCGFRDLPSEED